MKKVPTDASTAITPAGAIDGVPSFNVDAWRLPSPDIEYYADVCHAHDVDGAPTLYFAQRSIEGRVVNTVAISMVKKRFLEMVASFSPVVGKLAPEVVQAGHKIADAAIKEVSPENFRKLFASLVRGGASEDGAMMDFYRISLPVAEALRRGFPPDLVQGCVRVFLTSEMFVHLFDIIAREGLDK